MIRQERFQISKRPYAVDLHSLQVTSNVGPSSVSHRVAFDAVWFRRRRGVTVACIGHLWDRISPAADLTADTALRAMEDGRYGGAWVARWDGENYASEVPQSPEAMERHLAILRPMLECYPAVPRGYDGWYYFHP